MCKLGQFIKCLVSGRYDRLPSPNPQDQGEAQSLCLTCSELSIHRILRDGVAREAAIPLGPLVTILEKAERCDFCRLVVTAFRRSWLLDKHPDADLSGIECSLFAEECGCLQDPAPPIRELCHRVYVLPSDRPRDIYESMLSEKVGMSLDIQVMASDAHIFGRSPDVHGRVVNDIVNLDLVKEWLQICGGHHKDACEAVWWRDGDERLPDSVRMVDVDTLSIVPAPPSCRYIALSYVWGGVGAEYQSMQANIVHRMTPGGLDLGILPATITDAIELCRRLGERWLWIDALCIVQDDRKDVDVQIGVMELIYGTAFLTIFAAGGRNAHAGLPGLRERTRAKKQHIEVIQNVHLAVPLPTLGAVLTQSVWGTRGWTYQELMLSRRRLYFTEHQVYFECGQEVWCEDVFAESNRTPRSYHPLRYTGGGSFTTLKAPRDHAQTQLTSGYTSVIGQYTQRELTNETDTIDAVSALTNAFTKAFKLGAGVPSKAFRFGMALADLDHALLWQPAQNVLLTRRNIPGQTSWPSWSWAGWRGPVEYRVPWSTALGHPIVAESLIRSWYICEHGALARLDVRPIAGVGFPEEGGRRRYVPPSERADPEQAPHASEGALVFRTTAATFKAQRIDGVQVNEDARYEMFALLPAAGRIYLPRSTMSPLDLRLITLSRCNAVAGLYDTQVYGDMYSGGCFLNVMAVQESEQRKLERIGIGIIFEQAWIEANAAEEQVCLA
ncbi:hypothetical protein EYR40_010066 [Pleurotus pulmonarius]|nr:hypothetical protein EYR36_010538 [Pleurotus pulmonarius]KAF4588514.1 hypothetical protein EYR40_010066 [Pleurotus pulmonarius]